MCLSQHPSKWTLRSAESCKVGHQNQNMSSGPMPGNFHSFPTPANPPAHQPTKLLKSPHKLPHSRGRRCASSVAAHTLGSGVCFSLKEIHFSPLTVSHGILSEMRDQEPELHLVLRPGVCSRLEDRGVWPVQALNLRGVVSSSQSTSSKAAKPFRSNRVTC